jgi:hypothetical protein
MLDEGHRQFKKANPKYARREEKMTTGFRRMTGQQVCQDLYNKYGEPVGQSCE